MSLEKIVYVGPFAHCKTLEEVDICPDGAIGVNEEGIIAFVLRDVQAENKSFGEGWEQAKVVRIKGHGFFFPGFIGTSIHIRMTRERH